MTLPWPIFSSLLLIAAVLRGGEVSGRVQVIGAGKNAPRSGGVVVWLEPRESTHVTLPHPATVQMIQRKKEFRPHVLAIPVNSTVDFPNFDPIFHNAFSNGDGQQFDVGLYPPGTSRRVTFRKPGIVRVFCNIHQSMSAVIVVQPTPYLAVSDTTGAFTFGQVAPGDYTLRIFYERATQKTLEASSREVRVGSDGQTLQALTITEEGYIAAPHTNKFGKEYPPEAGDSPAYPAQKR